MNFVYINYTNGYKRWSNINILKYFVKETCETAPVYSFGVKPQIKPSAQCPGKDWIFNYFYTILGYLFFWWLHRVATNNSNIRYSNSWDQIVLFVRKFKYNFYGTNNIRGLGSRNQVNSNYQHRKYCLK